MRLLQILTALGLLLSVYPLGRLILPVGGGTTNHRGTPRLVFLCVGSAAWTILMIACATAGAFNVMSLGILGWSVVALYLWRLRGSSNDSWLARLRSHLTARSLIAAVIILVAAWLYSIPPKQSILGDRDEGIYVQHAMHLVRTGGSSINIAELGLGNEPRITAISTHAAPALPGIYPTGDAWTFQFSAATPVWMAVLQGGFGSMSVLRFNPLIALLNCAAFYLLATLCLPSGRRVWALVALTVYAFNPIQLWIARNTLSEPFMTWFVLCGMLAAVAPGTCAERRRGLIAGGLIGVSTFVRIDGVMFLLALTIALLLGRLSGLVVRNDSNDRMLKWSIIGCTCINIIALLYYTAFLGDYLDTLYTQIIPILIAIVLGLTLVKLCSMPRAVQLLHWIKPRAGIAMPILALTAFAYGMWLRPLIPPFSTIQSDLVPSLNGMRDFREHSLQNLASYLSPPVVMAAAIGLAVWLRRIWTEKPDRTELVVFAFFLFPVVAYLWNPMVSPDHIWAARRWVPAVVPGSILLAAFAIATIAHRFPALVNTALAIAAIVGLSTHLLMRQRDTIFFEEDAGVFAQIHEIATFLPPSKSYVLDNGPLASALLTVFGKPVIPLSTIKAGPQSVATLGLQKQCSATAPCLILHAKSIAFTGPHATLVAHGKLVRSRRNTSMTAPAKGVHVAEYDYHITRIGG